MALTACYTS